MNLRIPFGGFIKNNLLYSSVSYAFRLFLNIVIFVLLARYFNVSNFGIISLFIIIINLISVSSDLGFRLLIVRELSVRRDLLDGQYILDKFWLKLLSLFIVSSIVIAYSYANDFWGYNIVLVISLIVSGFFLNLSNTLFSVFQSFNKYYLEASSLFVMIVLLSFTLVISRRPDGIALFFYGYSVSMVITFFTAFYFLNAKVKKLRFSNWKIPSFKAVKKEILIILPFTGIIILEALNFSFDSFFVEQYCSAESLGEYSALIRLVSGLTIFSTILASACMPALSRITADGVIKSKVKLFTIYGVIVLSGLFIFLVYYLLNDHLIKLLLGDKYLFLLEWDKYIFFIAISDYLRVLPGIFLVTFNREKIRLYLVLGFLIYGAISFYVFLPGNESDTAASTMVTIRIVTTVVMVAYFFYLVFFDSKKK